MAIKYRSTYKSVNGDDYTINFDQRLYVGGNITDIIAKAEIGLNSIQDISHPIRSKYLSIEVIATEDNDFSDLLTAEEREWQIELFRNSQKIFYGYLSSEGTTVDYTSDRYPLIFNVLDPLAFLEDLAFTDNLGVVYTGDEQLAKVIAKCLNRGFDPPRSTRFDIKDYSYYDYISENDSEVETTYTGGRFLKDVIIDQDQYLDDDSGEPMSCLEVLSQILSSLQLCVFQVEGSVWVIHHYLYGVHQDVTYIQDYDSDGNDTTEIVIDTIVDEDILTHDIETVPTDIIHCNENQSYSFKRSDQKIALDFEYIYKKQLLENGSFDGGVNNVSMPNWVTGGDYSEARDNGLLKIYKYDSSVNTNDFAAVSDSEIYVISGQRFKLSGSFMANYDDPIFYFNVKYIVGVTTYRLGYFGDESPLWTPSTPTSNPFFQTENGLTTDFEFLIPETFDSGIIEIEIYACRNAGTQTTSPSTKFVELYELTLTAGDNIRTGLTGVNENTDVDSLKSSKEKTYLNTQRGSVLSNQLIKLNLGDPITKVMDKHFSATYQSLLETNTVNRLKYLRQRRVFSGDFYNFFHPHQFIGLSGLSANRYFPIEFRIDTKTNVGSFRAVEVIESSINTDYEEREIYGQTIQPKIKS
jgi:hypothetical protein